MGQQMYLFAVISTLECPIMRDMLYRSHPRRYRFVAKLRRPVCEVTSFHFSSVISFPARNAWTVAFIPTRRHIARSVSLNVTVLTVCKSLFSARVGMRIGLHGIEARVCVFCDMYVMFLPSRFVRSSLSASENLAPV